MQKYLTRLDAPQLPPYDSAAIAAGLTAQLAQFLFPLLVELDRLLDKRLVRSFLQIIAVILTFRDRANGLLLSELGGYLLTAAQAPAGTKRLSNVLHSAKWTASLISRFLWQRASAQVSHWQQTGQDGLVIWDESGWEKPESWHLADLGPTRSSQAARLTHIKPGYYSPPRGPIFVPGLQWLAVLLIGRRTEQGPPLLAAQRWWTNRGPHTSYKRDEEGKLLVELAVCWGRAVMHVFDQGEAPAFWLSVVLAYQLRFVPRWQVELSWNFEKSELAFQSPRVYEGEPREKLLLLATLADAFLLTLLQTSFAEVRLWLLRSYCHRTGLQCRLAKLPLPRLRCALSRLWQERPPNFALLGVRFRQIQVTPVV